MNGKLMMSLGLCLMFGLTVVSAASVSNVQTNYDKKTNTIYVEYDLHLNKECIGSIFNAYDHKDNKIGSSWTWVPGEPYPISCMYYRGEVYWRFSKTGTFHKKHIIDATAKKNIKGLGKLDWEINHYGDVLASGKL